MTQFSSSDSSAARSPSSSSRASAPPPVDLPEIRFRVTASLSVLSQAKLECAQAKMAAELDRAVGISELLELMMDDFLARRPDGTVPGRKRIDGSIYRVVRGLPGRAEGGV